MAFASHRSASSRTRTAAGVAVVEAVAIYAVITGLTITGTIDPIAVFRANNIPVPPKPVPTPPVPQDRHKSPVEHRHDTIVTPPNGFDTILRNRFEADQGAGNEIFIGPSPIPDTGPLHPVFATVAAHPRGHPGDWVTANDYPSQDLREGNQGIVRFQLAINAQGRVTNCTVTQSSGFPGLDAATCARLAARARFDPASDESGTKVAGTYASAVRWTIPAE